ncbi:cytochrome biogenesis protein [Paenibacillus cisolokensis]|uniref:Cytochrome biogenesis protein n=1 Tax=Paenibacillus cisolokensis TaxID=1658519 RepID=A0ABQ4N2Z1_9BACL|nr:sulfite exporter TauE/SafE family protein [Paenibacillus cisolokensis]GIQ62493.1 cytochrome biogenesis protein [Paenibacillus cisolokensis]
MNAAQWGSVMLTGLFSAPHCIGMCGGIVSSVALQSSASARRVLLLYNGGRVFSYTLLGAAMGAAGSFLDLAGRLAGVQGAASIVGGCFVLLWLWRKFQLPLLRRVSGFLSRRLRPGGKTRRSAAEDAHLLATGFAFGFLPCGLTYAMQMNAAASGVWWQGALVMGLFGLSTFPALAAAGWLASYAGKRWRRMMRYGATAAAVIVGTLSIMRGLAANGVVPTLTPWLW